MIIAYGLFVFFFIMSFLMAISLADKKTAYKTSVNLRMSTMFFYALLSLIAAQYIWG